MTAPMVLGSDSARVAGQVQHWLGSRGYRMPVDSWTVDGVSADDLARARWVVLERLGWTARQLGHVETAVSALVNYYRAIGAKHDAARWDDLRFDLQIVRERTALSESARGVGSRRCRWEGSCDAESHASALAWESFGGYLSHALPVRS